jgi:DNA replication protein DnaC
MLAQPTLEKLTHLRLEGMLQAYKDQLGISECQGMSFEERLGLLVDRELTNRDDKRLVNRLRMAKLRMNACVEDLDFGQPRGLDKGVVMNLAGCKWIGTHDNCLIVGPTGAGKSYLACALGHKACREGYRVLYLRFPRLLEELAVSKVDGRYLRLLSHLAKYDLLILDDWAAMPLADEQRRALFEILEDRYDCRSTLVASQIPIEKWHDALGDPTLADAILDRLVHNAHKIVLKGESMRKMRKAARK